MHRGKKLVLRSPTMQMHQTDYETALQIQAPPCCTMKSNCEPTDHDKANARW